MKSSKKTFAQRYSSDFEMLVLDVVRDALNKDFEIIASSNTKEKSDGGFDGYCYIKSPYDEFSAALLEAKLRSAISDLPLSDFSKSIIIATNLDAACIIIGTNLYFSGNTVEQLESFIYNTGLEIRTIDYTDLSVWLSKRPARLKKYNKEFIREIKKYLDCEHKTASRTLSLYEFALKYHDHYSSPKIYGNNKKTAKKIIINRITEQNSTIVVIGEEGIGKKTLIDNAIYSILSSNTSSPRYVANKMDMNVVSGKNDFIYKVISLLWGCDYKETVGFFEGLRKNNGNEFLGLLPKHIIKYLTDLSQIYSRTVDIDVFFSYLSILYERSSRNNRIKRIFYFFNLEYCSNCELFKYIITFVRKLSNMISIIVCLPNDGYLKKRDAKWSEFFDAVLESKNVYRVELENWQKDDAICFVKDNLGNTKLAQCSEKLVDYFGIKPTFLSLGITLVEKDPIVLNYILENNISLDESFDLNKLRSLVYYCIDKLTGMHLEILFLMEIIGDNVSIEYICAVLEIDKKSFYKTHNNLGMFFVVRCGMYCWLQPMIHKLITESNCIRLSIYEKTKIYKNASKNLKLLDYDELVENEVLLKIALLSNNETDVYIISKLLLESYDKTEQYGKKYWLTNCIINRDFVFWDRYYNIYLRVEWLYASYSIGKNGDNTDFLEKYHILKDIINSNIKDYDYSDSSFNLLFAKYYHISARIHLAFSNYEEMQNACMRGFMCLSKAKTEDEFIILSELCSDYAISIKHIKNIEECVKFLDENDVIKNNPEVSETPMYMISYHTHYASQFTGSDPQKALDEFLEIEETCKGYSKEVYLHNQNNIAAMKLILKDYQGALSIAEKVYSEAYENNISVEFGRCQNTLGCISWQNNDAAKAKYYFNSCYHHFETHNHDTHLWAPLVNLAILCYMTNDNDTFFYTKKAYDFLNEHHYKQINSAKVYSDNVPKIVVAILMLLYIISHLDIPFINIDNALDSMKNKRIKELYYNRFVDTPINNILAESSYNCDGKIMLKV